MTATTGITQVSLSWTVSDNAAGYDIYRGTISGGETLLASPSGTGTTYTDCSVTNGTTYYYEVTAVRAGGQSGVSNEVTATPGNDWFANLPDLGLQNLARTDFIRDGSITYSDMLGLLNLAVTETGSGTMSTAVVASLQALASSSGSTYLNMAPSLQGLTQNLVNGGLVPVTIAVEANTTTAAQLQGLINQWFLGEDLPTIDSFASGYALANDGTLFGSSGAPQYTDVFQGERDDCWLMASCAGDRLQATIPHPEQLHRRRPHFGKRRGSPCLDVPVFQRR